MATKTKSKKTKASKKTQESVLRRGALAYVGIYGLAYDRLVLRTEQARKLTESLFSDTQTLIDECVEKGEVAEKKAEVFYKQSQTHVMKRYGQSADLISSLMPFGAKKKVAGLEAELEELTAKLDGLTKKAKKTATKAKKTVAKKVETITETIEDVAEKVEDIVEDVVETVTEKVEDVVEAVTGEVEEQAQLFEAKADDAVARAVAKQAKVTASKAASKTTSATTAKEPRHIPYFNDVKRYDPLANEDIVRKIVNHCGIALRSEDARYVACSDESERATVRDSWLKRKLGLEGSDADLDKKVLEVCSLMQRDQRKNRVTFYYLLAKKERMLETL